MALETWSIHNGPVVYQQWQSVYFALTRDHGMVYQDTYPGETKAEKAQRMKESYHSFQLQLHGDQYLALAAERKKKKHTGNNTYNKRGGNTPGNTGNKQTGEENKKIKI